MSAESEGERREGKQRGRWAGHGERRVGRRKRASTERRVGREGEGLNTESRAGRRARRRAQSFHLLLFKLRCAPRLAPAPPALPPPRPSLCAGSALDLRWICARSALDLALDLSSLHPNPSLRWQPRLPAHLAAVSRSSFPTLLSEKAGNACRCLTFGGSDDSATLSPCSMGG